MASKKPTMLLIMDGWGLREDADHNAIAIAKTPNFDRLWRTYPRTAVTASGEAVGLPAGLMGNSEVGHLNLGAGRVVWQDIARIDRAIKDGSFFENEVLAGAMRHAKKKGAKLHLMGLVSDGGVHTADRHYFALIEMARRLGVPSDALFFHALMDGRDTPPTSGRGHLAALEDKLAAEGVGRVATICGRYYMMDRDKRWERVEKGFRALRFGEGHAFTEADAAIRDAYDRGETDEFITPIKIVDSSGTPLGLVEDGDAFIFFNFRADRTREISHAFLDDEFTDFDRGPKPALTYVSMTHYEDGLPTEIAFPLEPEMPDIYAEVMAKNGLRQLRIAETEKYAHVTFFFSGGIEDERPLEERILIPSPKVATYDLQPEMSAYLVTERVIREVDRDHFDTIVLNFANHDMVGHTGVEAAAVRAIEVVDECLGTVTGRVLAAGGQVLVTADHGNAEKMVDENGDPHTAHTTNPVPCILVSEEFKDAQLRKNAALCDIVPTLLAMMGVEKPAAMGGESIIS